MISATQASVPIFCDTSQAAEHLNVSASTMEKWRMTGAGPAFRKHGRRVLYLRADLDGWSAAQERHSTGEAA